MSWPQQRYDQSQPQQYINQDQAPTPNPNQGQHQYDYQHYYQPQQPPQQQQPQQRQQPQQQQQHQHPHQLQQPQRQYTHQYAQQQQSPLYPQQQQIPSSYGQVAFPGQRYPAQIGVDQSSTMLQATHPGLQALQQHQNLRKAPQISASAQAQQYPYSNYPQAPPTQHSDEALASHLPRPGPGLTEATHHRQHQHQQQALIGSQYPQLAQQQSQYGFHNQQQMQSSPPVYQAQARAPVTESKSSLNTQSMSQSRQPGQGAAVEPQVINGLNGSAYPTGLPHPNFQGYNQATPVYQNTAGTLNPSRQLSAGSLQRQYQQSSNPSVAEGSRTSISSHPHTQMQQTNTLNSLESHMPPVSVQRAQPAPSASSIQAEQPHRTQQLQQQHSHQTQPLQAPQQPQYPSQQTNTSSQRVVSAQNANFSRPRASNTNGQPLSAASQPNSLPGSAISQMRPPVSAQNGGPHSANLISGRTISPVGRSTTSLAPSPSYPSLVNRQQPGTAATTPKSQTAPSLQSPLKMMASQTSSSTSQQPRQLASKPPSLKTPVQRKESSSGLSSSPLPQKVNRMSSMISTVPSALASPATDYTGLLVALSDNYVESAHKLVANSPGGILAVGQVDEYNKLIATALGCLDSILKRLRQPPSVEATLRLKYATLLFSETESWYEVEQTLSKGIVLCDRNKFINMRYAMLHLMIRALFKTQPRAAIKSIDKSIGDLEMLGHVPWIYAFRFLRACLAFQTPHLSESNSALQNLRAIVKLAERSGDQAVVVTASAFEAMSHLKSKSPEGAQLIQQSIAVARSHQLDSTIKGCQHIWSFLDIVDLSACLQEGRRSAAKQKLERLQRGMDELPSGNSAGIGDNGRFLVPIAKSHVGQQDIAKESFGVFVSIPEVPEHNSEEGKALNGSGSTVSLSFTWLSNDDLYMMGYYLSGLTLDIHNMNDQRAEAYLKQALHILDDSTTDPDAKMIDGLGCHNNIVRHHHWKQTLRWHIGLHQAFSACRNEKWDVAARLVAMLQAMVKNYFITHPSSPTLRPDDMRQWITYLTCLVDQGCGHFERALEGFRSPILSISELFNKGRTGIPAMSVTGNGQDSQLLSAVPPKSPSHASATSSSVFPSVAHTSSSVLAVGINPSVDLRLLSGIHIMLINKNQPAEWAEQFSQLQSVYANHPNRSIATAFYFLQCVVAPFGLTELKSNLQTALKQAMDVTNNQLLILCLTLLCSRFYLELVSPIAEKTALTLCDAAKNDGKAWKTVTLSMLAQIMETNSKLPEATRAREQAEAELVGLTPKLLEKLER